MKALQAPSGSARCSEQPGYITVAAHGAGLATSLRRRRLFLLRVRAPPLHDTETMAGLVLRLFLGHINTKSLLRCLVESQKLLDWTKLLSKHYPPVSGPLALKGPTFFFPVHNLQMPMVLCISLPKVASGHAPCSRCGHLC